MRKIMNDFQLQQLKNRIGKMRTPITDEELLSLVDQLESAEQGLEYWKSRCVSAEAFPKKLHLDKVRSGFFSQHIASGKEPKA